MKRATVAGFLIVFGCAFLSNTPETGSELRAAPERVEIVKEVIKEVPVQDTTQISALMDEIRTLQNELASARTENAEREALLTAMQRKVAKTTAPQLVRSAPMVCTSAGCYVPTSQVRYATPVKQYSYGNCGPGGCSRRGLFGWRR